MSFGAKETRLPHVIGIDGHGRAAMIDPSA
jgi:hypothetical protein